MVKFNYSGEFGVRSLQHTNEIVSTCFADILRWETEWRNPGSLLFCFEFDNAITAMGVVNGAKQIS